MATARPRLLLVEDQRDIAANIWDYLERRGFDIDLARDGVLGLSMAKTGSFDLIVLDLGLPRLDGLAVCQRLRDAGDGVPVLMLTARDTLDDVLAGFARGADDYLVKPFAMAELEARIRALLRRGSAQGPELVIGDLRFDPQALLASRQGRRLVLSKAQAALLLQLMQRSPQIVSHADLIDAVWSDDPQNLAALHTLVYSVRGLIDKPFDKPLIRSVRGVGYALDPQHGNH